MDKKFLARGKRTDNDEWIEGNFIEQEEPEYHTYICTRFKAEINDKYTDIIEYDIKEIKPETIGRFTGKTDKNGNKVFENDVVCIDYFNPWINQWIKMLGIVKWENCAYVVVWNDCVHDDEFLDFLYNIEVIGNIYDNPELKKAYIE